MSMRRPKESLAAGQDERAKGADITDRIWASGRSAGSGAAWTPPRTVGDLGNQEVLEVGGTDDGVRQAGLDKLAFQRGLAVEVRDAGALVGGGDRGEDEVSDARGLGGGDERSAWRTSVSVPPSRKVLTANTASLTGERGRRLSWSSKLPTARLAPASLQGRRRPASQDVASERGSADHCAGRIGDRASLLAGCPRNQYQAVLVHVLSLLGRSGALAAPRPRARCGLVTPGRLRSDSDTEDGSS